VLAGALEDQRLAPRVLRLLGQVLLRVEVDELLGARVGVVGLVGDERLLDRLDHHLGVLHLRLLELREGADRDGAHEHRDDRDDDHDLDEGHAALATAAAKTLLQTGTHDGLLHSPQLTN
jgi:hypothetical protein